MTLENVFVAFHHLSVESDKTKLMENMLGKINVDKEGNHDEQRRNKALVILGNFDHSSDSMKYLKASVRNKWQDVYFLKSLGELYVNFLRKTDSNKRTTLADLGDQLVALQLSMHDKMVAIHNIEAAPSSNEIWELYQQIMNHKLRRLTSLKNDCPIQDLLSEEILLRYEVYESFCKKCNLEDVVDYCNEVCNCCSTMPFDVMIFDTKRNALEMIFLQHLLQLAKAIIKISFDEANSFEISDTTRQEVIEVMKQQICWYAVSGSPKSKPEIENRGHPTTVKTPVYSKIPSCIFYHETPRSCAQNQLRKILLSYLRLLINSRDEIALSRVINAPSRDLDHRAFTDLRKTAQMKNLPMFQTAVSFIRQIKLGGKGYAPGEGCLLSRYVKGLSEFVALMNKLQGIMEDANTPSDAFRNILRSLRLAFTKAKVQMFRPETVVCCIEELQAKLTDKLERIMKDQNTPTSSIVELRVILALKALLDEDATTSFLEFENGDQVPYSLLATPEMSNSLVKIQSLNSKFRTPEENKIETPKRAKRKKEFTKSMDRRSTIGDMRWAATEINKETNEKIVESSGTMHLETSDGINSNKDDDAMLRKEHRIFNEIVDGSERNDQFPRAINKTDDFKENRPAHDDKCEIKLIRKRTASKTGSRKANRKKANLEIPPGQRKLTNFFKKST